MQLSSFRRKGFVKEYGVPFPIAIGTIAKEPEVEFSPLFDQEKVIIILSEISFIYWKA